MVPSRANTPSVKVHSPNPSIPRVPYPPRIDVHIAPEYGWVMTRVGGATVWFKGHLYAPPLDGIPAAVHLAQLIQQAAGAKALADLLRTLDGHFACVVASPNRFIAAVDRIRSSSLLYSLNGERLVVDSQAPRLCRHLSLDPKDLDPEGALPLAMSGYTLGNTTLYRSLKQLRAGEFLLWERDEEAPCLKRYYLYQPWQAHEEDPDLLGKRFTDATFGIFEKLVSSAAGRTILVPLSAGLDSRLIVSALAELGCRNVQCFAYGQPGNYEASVSKLIAKRLGYPWFFLPVSHWDMARHYRSEEHAAYLAFADSCAAVPVEHEYAPVKLLLERGYSTEDVILVNGQSGDYLSGSHIPQSYWTPEAGGSVSARKEALFAAAVSKHYSLWGALKTPENLERLASLFWTDLAEAGEFGRDPEVDYAFFEFSEWQNRQSKYVVSGQRVYEFFGFDWRLPLWHKDFLDFWETVPLSGKTDRKLFRTTLYKLNWRGVWRDVPVRRYVSPRWLRALRPLAKFGVGWLGRTTWHRFEHQYLDYWNDIQGKIAIVPYVRVLQDKRGWRSGVSWLTEAYLNRYGLDFAGRPLQRT